MNVMPRSPFWGYHQDISFSFWAENVVEGDLAVTAFAVDEAVFGMTRIEVMLSSENPDIDLEAIVDNNATLAIQYKYIEKQRYFSGIVVEAERGNQGLHRTAYRVMLLPVIYRLEQGSDCRIFQSQTVPQIVASILAEHGIHNVEWQLGGEHMIREFCVQYRETHLCFIERILAEEGIFYYFSHDCNGMHKLILTDVPENIIDCPEQSSLAYNALSSGVMKKKVYCSSLKSRKKVRTTSYVQRDYSFKNPAHNFEQRNETSHPTGESKNYEMFDYPGRYKHDTVGKTFTRYKLEAARVDSYVVQGIANAPHLTAGYAFLLEDYPDDKLNQKWRLLNIRHEGVQPQAWGQDAMGVVLPGTGITSPSPDGVSLAGLSFGVTGSQSPGLLVSTLVHSQGGHASRDGVDEAKSNATLYSCAFSAMPAKLPYRPLQKVKPVVDGPQIAIVVGPPGEQIYTDEYGRVKVHFPWDRYKEPNAEDSSCWIRVSQSWGGGTWGQIAIPRIGQEVIVEFLEGDPDQPIITGRTYHATNKTPYKLPENKTKMAIRSDSHKGNGGFNELSFEDEYGFENMFMHAEKDQTIKVKNNQIQRIDANVSQSVGANHVIEIGNNVNQHVGGGVNMVVGAVGSAATSLLGNVLSGLMNQSANLLNQGMSLAVKAMQAARGNTAGMKDLGAISSTEADMGNALSSDSAEDTAQSKNIQEKSFVKQAEKAERSGIKPMMQFAAKKEPAEIKQEAAFTDTNDFKAAQTGIAAPSESPSPLLHQEENVSPNEVPVAPVVSNAHIAPVAPVARKAVEVQPDAEKPKIVSPADDINTLSTQTSEFSNFLSIGGSIAGLASIASGFDLARSGINNVSQYNLRNEGGASMASAGANLAQSVSSLIGGGIYNQLVSRFYNITTGIASTEQVGQVKISTVGQVSTEQVGNIKQMFVGEKFILAVGKDEETGEPMSMLVLDANGKVTISGKEFDFVAKDHVKLEGGRIDLNQENSDK